MPPFRVAVLAKELPSIFRQSHFRTVRPIACAKLQRRCVSTQELDAQREGRERIVILGSGWAGFNLARDVNPRKYQVVVVSPRSYFVFTPLLASTSVGTLEFRTALESIRPALRKRGFFQGWADAVDFDSKTLTIEEAAGDPRQGSALTADPQERKRKFAEKGQLFDLKYDKLVIAVGCYSQTFNTKGVRENAFFLKDVGDARRIRNRLLFCFEAAALPTTSDEMKKQLLNFAVVGGGPTGIEFSAELHDIINEDMKKLYPDLIKYANITVYDVAPNVLNMFDDKLSKFAVDHFRREGIKIKTNHHVEELRRGVPPEVMKNTTVKDADSCYTIKFKEEGEIGIGFCVWSTGLMMNPFVKQGLEGKAKRHAKTGGLSVTDRLQVKNEDGGVLPEVYALGDCASMESANYPATAQVASQEAKWLAKRFNKNDLAQNHFTYKDLGVMAYVGNWNAILQSQGQGISGRVAWILWRSAYLVKSLSWRNKILIPIYWVINWIFGRDISRF